MKFLKQHKKTQLRIVKVSKNFILYFSYETLVAFSYKEKTCVAPNIWTNTTGKHINIVKVWANSLVLFDDIEEFKAEYNKTLVLMGID